MGLQSTVIGLYHVCAMLIKLMGFGVDPHGGNQISPPVQPPPHVSTHSWKSDPNGALVCDDPLC